MIAVPDKVARARELLGIYEAMLKDGDRDPASLRLARHAAYELVGLACALHTAADPGAAKINGAPRL